MYAYTRGTHSDFHGAKMDFDLRSRPLFANVKLFLILHCFVTCIIRVNVSPITYFLGNYLLHVLQQCNSIMTTGCFVFM